MIYQQLSGCHFWHRKQKHKGHLEIAALFGRPTWACNVNGQMMTNDIK